MKISEHIRSDVQRALSLYGTVTVEQMGGGSNTFTVRNATHVISVNDGDCMTAFEGRDGTVWAGVYTVEGWESEQQDGPLAFAEVEVTFADDPHHETCSLLASVLRAAGVAR